MAQQIDTRIGATLTAAVAAGAAAAVSANPGRLHKILVTTAGSAALVIYDNASAAAGTIVGSIPANAAAGTIYDLQMPVENGIYVAGGSNTPAVTVAYS